MNTGLKRRTFLLRSRREPRRPSPSRAAPVKKPGKKPPLVIATLNGESTSEKIMERIKSGADPLDAAIEGIAAVQLDPKDPSIGIGGFPNMAGVVELDALVMHGLTHGVGAVAALQEHDPSRRGCSGGQCRRTRHSLLVGDGAPCSSPRLLGFPGDRTHDAGVKRALEDGEESIRA